MTAWPRIKSFLYDYLIILFILPFLLGVGLWLTQGPLSDWWTTTISTPGRLDFVAFCTTVLPVMVYFVVAESSDAGGSWGKRRIGLRVVDLDGNRLSVGRAFIRSAVKFTPWQMAHTAIIHMRFAVEGGELPPDWTTALLIGTWLLLGLFLFGLTKYTGHRTIYDRLSGSKVVEIVPS